MIKIYKFNENLEYYVAEKIPYSVDLDIVRKLNIHKNKNIGEEIESIKKMIQKGGAVEMYSEYFKNDKHAAFIISYGITPFVHIHEVPFEALKEIDAETWQKISDANKFGL